MATTDELRRRSDAVALMSQIPAGGYPKAPAADGSQGNPLNTELGRNVTNTLAALPGAAAVPGVAALASNVAARALGASAPAVTAVGRLAQSAAPYAPVAGGAAAINAGASADRVEHPSPAQSLMGNSTGAAASNPTDQRLAAGTQTTPVAPGLTNQVMPGVYQHGRGQYSDSPDGMNFKPGFTGQPSAQNIALVDGLAARALSQAPVQSQGLAQAAGVIAPTVLHSGNSWAARNDLRNAEISASSMTNQPGYGGVVTRRGVVGGLQASPAQAKYQELLGADQAARAAENTGDLTAMRENAGLQREGMQQTGASQRSLMQYATDQQRLALDRERQGFASREAQQLEAQRSIIADPRSTPEQRSAAERALMTFHGKTQQADPYLVVPGGQGVSEDGKPYNMPSSVFNRQTGQFVQQVSGGAGGALGARAQAIRNDKSMTREQKYAELEKLKAQGWVEP